MLPVVVGDNKTALYTLLNTILLVGSSLLPYVLGYNGLIYLFAAVSVGAYFIWWNVKLLKNPEKNIAWKNFKISMMYLGVLFTSVIIDMAIKSI